jgi:hypothetical protein
MVSISESAAALAADVLAIDTAKRLTDSLIPGQAGEGGSRGS